MPKFHKEDPDLEGRQLIHENDIEKFPDRIVVPQCKICSSKYRDEVDLWLARGYSMASIQRTLQGGGLTVSLTSISRHKENHLPMQIAAYREILENNLIDYQQVQGEGAMRMVTGAAFIDILIAKGYESLVDGELTVEAKDIIKAIEVKAAMDEKGVVEFQAQVMAQIEALKIAMEEELGDDEARRVLARTQEILDQKAAGSYVPKSTVVVEEEDLKAIDGGHLSDE